MAGKVGLQTPSGGSVTFDAAVTTTDKVLVIPAMDGAMVVADSVTGAAILPVGTTAQRPASPVNGMMRINSTLSSPEYYYGSTWIQFGGIPITYLIVAGGGAGDGYTAGGGGAGGFLTGTANLVSGTTYNIFVGAGGAGSTGQSPGTNGYSSTIDKVATALGGGAGRGTNFVGLSGGSGGGGGSGAAGGSSWTGQGNNGGANLGGGGGAGAVGNPNSGTGGNGLSSSITGTAVTYAGGGGGNGALGGTGGGNTVAQGSGAANTGGGGGGAVSTTTGGAGGSGVVIIRILTAQYSGTTTGSPTVTTDGSYTVVKYTASGTYTA